MIPEGGLRLTADHYDFLKNSIKKKACSFLKKEPKNLH
jgi:hypothetical protein